MEREREAGQLFLQCMMQRAALSKREAIKTYATCVGHVDPSGFRSFVSALNRQLKPLGMELARGHMEDTGEVWYGLVNRSTDAASKVGSGYSPAELELFNKALEMVVLSEDGCASSTDLLHTVPKLERKMTHREAQTFLKNTVKDKWFKEQSRGVFSPGPRLILELRPFLEDLFGADIVQCRLCKEPAIQGQKCSNEHCDTKLHLYCAAKLFSGRSVIRCPGCHGDWPHPPPQIDSAHFDEELSVVASTSSSSSAAGSSAVGGGVSGRRGKGKGRATREQQ